MCKNQETKSITWFDIFLKSNLALIVGLIAIPIEIVMIAENNQRTLFIILMCLTIPGFINAIIHLWKVLYHMLQIWRGNTP